MNSKRNCGPAAIGCEYYFGAGHQGWVIVCNCNAERTCNADLEQHREWKRKDGMQAEWERRVQDVERAEDSKETFYCFGAGSTRVVGY